MRVHAISYACSIAVVASAAAEPTEAPFYSSWMLNSIISRGQGLANSGTSTGQIEQGIFSSALRHAVNAAESTYPGSNSTIWSSYLSESLRNTLSSLTNITGDASKPLDRFSIGSALLHQYGGNATGSAYGAIAALRKSADLQTRNDQGGFWYYHAYPQWSYGDGMFSLPAWYIEHTILYQPQNLTAVVRDVVRQFDLLWNHTHKESDGLLVHGYDESKTAVWADPVTGASPLVWGRSMAWYLTGLLETLEVLPADFIRARSHLQSRFHHLTDAVLQAADNESGVWWQIVDQQGRQGNYLESSASALFTYNILRGARLGFVRGESRRHVAAGRKAWEYMRDRFVVPNANGTISWNGTVSVCSLNSSASYEYYTSQPINFNGLLGSSAFVLASLEYEALDVFGK